jgi:hypothetical protein
MRFGMDISALRGITDKLGPGEHPAKGEVAETGEMRERWQLSHSRQKPSSRSTGAKSRLRSLTRRQRPWVQTPADYPSLGVVALDVKCFAALRRNENMF